MATNVFPRPTKLIWILLLFYYFGLFPEQLISFMQNTNIAFVFNLFLFSFCHQTVYYYYILLAFNAFQMIHTFAYPNAIESLKKY